MRQEQENNRKTVNRRKFLTDAARKACGAGIAGLGLVFLAKQAQSLPATAIRPPGAGTESEFLGACVRCGLCVNDCPYPTLKLAELGEDVAVGTP